MLLVAMSLSQTALAGPAQTATTVTPDVTGQRPRTCLVLGGGGARGAAHIGVLEVLEHERIPIDCVVGTSMGAIVGGLYAAGYNAADIRGILDRIDWTDALRDKPARAQQSMRSKNDDRRFLGGLEVGINKHGIALPQGMIQGQNLELLLRRLFLPVANVDNFDHLPIPFRAIAANIGNGNKVVFARGDLATAIRASMSIPGAFAPIRVNGQLLVDGGMVDNVPIDEARRLGATRLIVVQVGSPLLAEKQLDSPFAIANQMLTALMKRETDAQLATLGPDDVLIHPDLGSIATQDFDRVGEAVKLGAAAAERLHTRLQTFAASTAQYATWQTHQHLTGRAAAPMVAFIDVDGTHSKTTGFISHRMSDLIGKPLDEEAVRKRIDTTYGEGLYQAIRWRTLQRDGKTGLLIEPVDKSWGPNFLRTTMRLSDDFVGNNSYQLLSELTFTGINSMGGEARVRLGFGRLGNLHAEFYQPWGAEGEFSIAPFVDYRAYNLPIPITNKVNYAEYRRSQDVGGVTLGWTPASAWRLSATLERGRDYAHLRVGDPFALPNISSNIGGITLGISRDTLDDVGFPSAGSRFDLSEQFQLRALGADASAQVTRFSWDQALAYGSSRWLLGLKYARSHGGQSLLATYSALGGLTNLSGYSENAILATQTAFARVVYFRRLGGRAGSLFSTPVYAGASAELGAWSYFDESLARSKLNPAGSLFLGVDTFIGPIFLGYGRARGGASSFYLTFGPLLRADSSY